MNDRTNALIKTLIDAGKFPRLLYKYRAIDSYTKKSLENGEFWFSPPEKFNDPFDCNLSETHKHSLNDFKSYLKDLNVSDYQIRRFLNKNKAKPGFLRKKAIETRRASLSGWGIFSLSKIQNNILMWSHYADSHKGIVIGFDMLEDVDFFNTPIEVKYQDTYTELNYFKDQRDSIIKNISTKSSLWSYEQEIRIYKNSPGLHKINKDAVKKICFGINCDPKSILEIKAICSKSGYSKVKFYKANISHGTFKITFSSV